jgi:uncharacterized protein (TIGR02246 family)
MRIQSRLAIVLLAGVAGLTLIGAAAPKPTGSEAVRTEVQQFMKAYVNAENGNDATALMEMVSRKPGVASITMGEITRGWEAIRTEVDKSVESEIQLQMTLGTIDVETLSPSMALAFAPCAVTLTMEHESMKLHGAITLVVEKSSGKWKVLHEHSSAQVADIEDPETQGD